VAFRHFALIRRNSLSRMAAIDPLLTVMSVSFRLGKVRVTRCACSNMSGDLPAPSRYMESAVGAATRASPHTGRSKYSTLPKSSNSSSVPKCRMNG
jgi:hypothetical protein